MVRRWRADQLQGTRQPKEQTLKIVAWNILNDGGRRLAKILDRIAHHAPDTVVLSEYLAGPSGDRLRAGLRDLGLPHQYASTDTSRTKAVLVASREPFEASLPIVEPLGCEH